MNRSIVIASLRLGKTSVDAIKNLSKYKSGVLEPFSIPVVCTQVPQELSEGVYVIIWLGSDNSKGIPTEWKQGYKAFGRVKSIIRGKSYNDESTIIVDILYAFGESINRLDFLKKASEAYYDCSALPIIGLDDHSNQTIRMLQNNGERYDIGAMFYALNSMDQSFMASLLKLDKNFNQFFQYVPPSKRIVSIQKDKNTASSFPRQIIYYGAPGTGKSHKIKVQLEGVPKENIFRTTFHPDSDYSTFVGAYKPTMEKSIDKIYTKDELISKLTEMKEGGVTYSPQKFGAKYWRSLKQLNLSDKKDIFQACGISDNYTVEFDKGLAVGEEYLACSQDSRIVYSFVSQPFLNAYMQAYRKPDENVYLIIEEINRGNCAQIFGDLFQLLDRNEKGVSEYTIKADADLKSFLEDEMGRESDAIKDGELCLPSNLYIYATMNTSDQSLFPVDSAFKRRWDWEYEPIKYKNTDWKIVITSTEYSWASFQRKVNDKILSATSSEDKMLGDYFVNPSDGVITDKVLLNKILFYLWNDVCKDGEGDIFKIRETEDVSFSELYGDGGKQKLIFMMDYLGVSKFENNKEDIDDDDDTERENGDTGKDRTRYTINGVGEYAKKNLAAELVKLYIAQNPTLSASEVVEKWKSLGKFVSHFVETQEEYDTRTDKEPRVRILQCGNENIYVSTNGWGGQGIMDSLISAIPERWNLKVEKIQ